MSWGSAAFGFGSLAALQGLGAQGGGLGSQQAAAMGSLQSGLGRIMGSGSAYTTSFKQEMQADVNDWLEGWDK